MCPWWCWSKGPRGPGACRIGRWSGLDHRRLAPARWVPARSRAGIQAFSRESPDAKSRGGMPPAPPFFYSPLVPTRSFWRLCHIVPVAGLLRYPCTCPDLETFFHKMLFQHIFPENASQIGVRISDEIAPPPDQRQRSQKRASGSKRAIKTGGPGAQPRPSFSPFLGRNGDPAGQAGPPGRCAPRVRRTGLPPPPWVRGRSFPLARFGDCCPGSVRGAISSGILRPIWNAFSGKNMLKKHFMKESLQIRARTWVP